MTMTGDVPQIVVEPDPGGAAEKTAQVQEERRRRRRKASEAGGREFDDVFIDTGKSLGKGAFGNVTTCVGKKNLKEFALKTVKKTRTRNRAKVLKEIDILMQCRDHPNIIYLDAYFETTEVIMLVFEKLAGGTLLENAWNRKSLTEQDVSNVVANIANGLSFLHRKGVAHRDLKPDNILCVGVDELVPLKLIDFDLASSYRLDSRSSRVVTTPRLGSPVGSVEFMAPEVVNAWQDEGRLYDKRCDLWSLGVILYILLCGYLPFRDVRCGQDCGWDHGLKCNECQEILFVLIQNGNYSFPDAEWSTVSDEAKELVMSLLVTDPCIRFNADDVLNHIWLGPDGERARASSKLLSLRSPAQNLSACVDSVTEVNRMVQMKLDSKDETRRDDSSSKLDETIHWEMEEIEEEFPDTFECGTQKERTEMGRKSTELDEQRKVSEDCMSGATVLCPSENRSASQSIELNFSEQRRHRWGSEDEGLIFHMSDISDEIGDWSEKEDNLVLWNGDFHGSTNLSTRLMFDEDEDSGNGNSVDSASVDCKLAVPE